MQRKIVYVCIWGGYGQEAFKKMNTSLALSTDCNKIFALMGLTFIDLTTVD